jgi:peptidoglycan/xylan/chitin deacetylase (PgdA/CDA1 family)
MSRRRLAALALATFALALTGCTTAANAGTHDVWHAPAISAGGIGGGTPVGSTGTSSSPTPSKSPTSSRSGTGSGSPSSSSSSSPAVPSRPAGPPASKGRGPAGSFTTTGTASVALTFDDGPGGNTSQVLDLLDRYGIKATFCIIGKNIAGQEAVIRRMVADGMTLCDHTWTHDESLSKRSAAQITSEIQRTADALHAVVPDAPIRYFRNPGGNFSAQTVAIAQSMGMTSLYWSVDPRDWSKPGTQSIMNNVMSHTCAGSIVLMHDGGGDRSETVAALQTILPNLKGRFTLVTPPIQ